MIFEMILVKLLSSMLKAHTNTLVLAESVLEIGTRQTDSSTDLHADSH